MADLTNARWRKFTDIEREHAIFELLQDDVILLDLGFSDTGQMEITFHRGICEFTVELDRLDQLVRDGVAIATRDLNE